MDDLTLYYISKPLPLGTVIKSTRSLAEAQWPADAVTLSSLSFDAPAFSRAAASFNPSHGRSVSAALQSQ